MSGHSTRERDYDCDGESRRKFRNSGEEISSYGDRRSHRSGVRVRSRSRSRSRSKSRSLSPERNDLRVTRRGDSGALSGRMEIRDDRKRIEDERRSRMARLRAENEEEERKMAALDAAAVGSTEKNGGKPLNACSALADASKDIVEVKPSDMWGMDEEEQMRKMLGFSGEFGSTKGKAVDDNHKSAARGAAAKNKGRKYRQYMNRKGGFNRPLDKML